VGKKSGKKGGKKPPVGTDDGNGKKCGGEKEKLSCGKKKKLALVGWYWGANHLKRGGGEGQQQPK